MLDTPRVEQGPGLRGRAVFFLKRVIRRLSWWYVEPRFDEVRAHLEDHQRTIVFLRKELDQTHREIGQMLLRLRQLEDKSDSTN